jgi:hypothetical protein
MKKTLLSVLAIITFQCAYSQTTPSPLEKAVTDSVCNCLSKIDMSKITNKDQATAAYSDCFTKKADLMMKLADEKLINPSDEDGMRKLGADIGKNLTQSCPAFNTISKKMTAVRKHQQEKSDRFVEVASKSAHQQQKEIVK